MTFNVKKFVNKLYVFECNGVFYKSSNVLWRKDQKLNVGKKFLFPSFVLNQRKTILRLLQKSVMSKLEIISKPVNTTIIDCKWK